MNEFRLGRDRTRAIDDFGMMVFTGGVGGGRRETMWVTETVRQGRRGEGSGTVLQSAGDGSVALHDSR